MTDGPIQAGPRRLAEEEGEAGSLLRRAAPEFTRGFDEARAFRRMERARLRRTALNWSLSAAAVAAAVVVVAATVVRSTPEPDRVTLDPEPVRPAEVARSEDVTSAAVVPRPRPPPSAATAPIAPRPAPEPVKEADCRRLVSAGKAERAVECFKEVSRGEGVQSEVALYEAARLTIERLQDASRGLALVDEYKRRFETGALRGEIEWLRVQALQRAGRVDEALSASEALLATPIGRNLAAELHFLRGRMLQDQRGDCARAASEFVSLIGEPGARGDEAELRRAECLERIGRNADARAAYERYLQRPNAAQAERARKRLSGLK